MRHLKTAAALTLVAVIAQFLPLPALALTKHGSDAKGNYAVRDKRSYPIIFIHGAAGAELDGAGGNYWPGTLWPNDDAFGELALTPDQKPTHGAGVWPTKVMRYGAGWEMSYFPDLTFASVYNGFYTYMEGQGFAYNKAHEDGKVFYDFVYDWRMDNHRWTADLDKKVDAVRAETGADKVILMGHSMGGIQVRLYMKDPARAAKVGGVVFLGSPQHGAPQVFWAYTQGYNFGNKKVSDAKMWEIMQNWPAGYQLLPDWTAVRDKKTGRVWSLDEMYGDGFISEQAYSHWIAGGKQGQPLTGLPNAALRRSVVPFHQELGDTATKYDGKYWLIRGDKTNTLQLLDATLVDVGLSKPLLKLERVETKAGDGTVPAKGSDLKGVDEDIYVPGAEHGDIPSDSIVQGNLTRIRKEINEEDFRDGLVKQAKQFADHHLADLASRRKMLDEEDKNGDGAPGLATIFWHFIFGVKDEKKVAARDELIDYASRSFQNSRVNLHIPANDKHKEDTLYATITGFQATDVGLGAIESPYVTINVKSYDVFDNLMKGADIRAALKNGDVDLVGGGFITKFKFKALQWINKYVKF